MLAGLMTSTPAAALQCVPFARAETGIEIYGNAKTWWAQAAGDYDRGQEPREGAVMAFAGARGMPLGPVAGVEKIVGDGEILVSPCNWLPIHGDQKSARLDSSHESATALTASACKKKENYDTRIIAA